MNLGALDRPNLLMSAPDDGAPPMLNPPLGAPHNVMVNLPEAAAPLPAPPAHPSAPATTGQGQSSLGKQRATPPTPLAGGGGIAEPAAVPMEVEAELPVGSMTTPGLPVTLQEQIRALVEKGQFQDAIKLVTDHVEDIKNTKGHNSLDVAAALKSLAEIHKKAGNIDAAVQALEDSATIHRSANPGDPAGRADLVSTLARYCDETGLQQKAQLYSKELSDLQKHSNLFPPTAMPIAVIPSPSMSAPGPSSKPKASGSGSSERNQNRARSVSLRSQGAFIVMRFKD